MIKPKCATQIRLDSIYELWTNYINDTYNIQDYVIYEPNGLMTLITYIIRHYIIQIQVIHELYGLITLMTYI